MPLSVVFAIIPSFCYAVVFFAGIFLNAVVIWLVHKTRSLQTVTNMWLVSMCCGHLLTSALLSLAFGSGVDGWRFGNTRFCEFYGFSLCTFRTISILSVAGIAVDRYHIVARPFGKRTSRATARLYIGFVWWTAVILCIPPLAGIGVYRYSPYSHICNASWRYGGSSLAYILFYVVAIYLSTLVVTLKAYGCIYKVTKTLQHQQAATALTAPNGERVEIATVSGSKLDSPPTPSVRTFGGFYLRRFLHLGGGGDGRRTHDSADGRAVAIMSQVIAVFVLAWSPYFVFAIYASANSNSSDRKRNQQGWGEMVTTAMSFVTCILDPLLYGVLRDNFSPHFKALIRDIRISCHIQKPVESGIKFTTDLSNPPRMRANQHVQQRNPWSSTFKGGWKHIRRYRFSSITTSVERSESKRDELNSATTSASHQTLSVAQTHDNRAFTVDELSMEEEVVARQLMLYSDVPRRTARGLGARPQQFGFTAARNDDSPSRPGLQVVDGGDW